MADDKKELPGDVVASFDQMGPHLENIAVLMGTYYRSLTRNGVPYDLAFILVTEYNRATWEKVFNGGKSNESST